MSEVRVLKLSNGEEVIARAAQISGGWDLTNPMILRVGQDQAGRPQAGLIPFFISSKDCEITISNEHVLASISAPADIEAGYLSQTSGIQLASSLMQ
jgi:hypothetical protein